MTRSATVPAPNRTELGIALTIFAACLLFNLWGVSVGWESRNLPGVEFRQAQTALSAHFIQLENNFSPAYPTPVLGKPWSVPMEFPLYQWTVVAVSNLTGLELTKAGRLVSVACFYLTLPAIFLLLGRMKVAAGRRWWVLAVVLTCPLYIFYSRAFLIETMAMMFSFWFWVAFEQTVTARSRGWLFVAIIAGSGAGLVKVTTFLVYLLPASAWAFQRLGRNLKSGQWRTDLAWIVMAVAIPLGLAVGWVRWADAIKAHNPSAQFLLSGNLRDFTLGTWTGRLSPTLWWQQWKIISGQMTWLPILGGGVLLALLAARRRARDMLRLLLWFGVALVAFPVLYARHEYYFVANGLLLLMALGLVLVGLAESRHSQWMTTLAALALTGGQASVYLDGYYQTQCAISPGGDGLTNSLRGLTAPDEVIVVSGQDWNSMTPYYARRRALMIREEAETNPAQLDAAFAALASERLGALVLEAKTQNRGELLRRAVARGLDPEPVYRWRNFSVHLPLARRSQSIQHLLDNAYDGLSWAPGVAVPAEPLAGAWREVDKLRLHQRWLFSAMRPEPVRFFSAFEPGFDIADGVAKYGAHPETRLVFHLSAGRHRLRTTVRMKPEAYAPELPEAQRTDGVEITLTATFAGEAQQVLFTRWVNPRDQPADRGLVPVRVEFTLEQPADVELSIGPGPAGSDVRDWCWLGRLAFD